MTAEPVVPLPASTLTDDDWARMHGEAWLAWPRLSPRDRRQRTLEVWDAYLALSLAERRQLMRGDSELAPGEFRRRLAEIRTGDTDGTGPLG